VIKFARMAAVMTVLLAGGCMIVTDDGTGPARPAGTTDASSTVTKSLKDVERFWTANFGEISSGKAFQPVTGGYHPYTEAQPAPACGGEQPEYQPNAFYCPDGDYIAWDAQNLIPQLQENFGPLLVGVVFAHEYGHAVQTRLGTTDQPTVVLEQQADCFAGAWLADVQAGKSTAFRKPTAKELDNTVAGLLKLRDQPGTSAAEEGAHGNAFDRIRALQDGVEKGVTTCAAYRSNNIPVTEVPFQDPKDQANGGDLSYEDAIHDLSDDAQGYWQQTYPQLTGQTWADLRVLSFDPQSPPDCAKPDQSAGEAAFACPAENFVAFDGVKLAPNLYRQLGDNAVGMLIGDLFARTAQDRRGASTQDKAGQLTVDCLAGTWTNSQLQRRPGGNQITLSPGDLDEAVGALLAIGRAGDESGPSAFDRIASYRNGVLGGLKACS
jgi:predicted metalloprotease